MSVHGIELFREAFEPFATSYALIGGSACDLLFDREGLRFRATKDLDIVVLSHRPSREFGEVFWDFVLKAGYTCGWRNSERVHFYRFTDPENVAYPAMIELFSRHPDFPLHDERAIVAPLPLEEDISSLSAIILDDDYFGFLADGLDRVEGLSVVDTAHIIPLKVRAHIDLSERKQRGDHVNERDLKKHRKDVLQLLSLLPAGMSVEVGGRIRADLRTFVDDMRDSGLRVDQLGLGMDLCEALQLLSTVYGLDI